MRLLFKCTSLNGKSTENPRNNPKVPGVITLVWNTGRKVLDYILEAKNAFQDIRMIQLASPEPKKMSNFYSGRFPVLLHPFLYGAIKLTFPAHVRGIVTDGQITIDIGTGSIGQSIGVPTPIDFRPVCA